MDKWKARTIGILIFIAVIFLAVGLYYITDRQSKESYDRGFVEGYFGLIESYQKTGMFPIMQITDDNKINIQTKSLGELCQQANLTK